jgi:hypothetical protein
MKAPGIRSSFAFVVIFCTGCLHHNSPPPQAQAPPLQTGSGTLSSQKATQPPPKPTSPLASPLPPPSAASVSLPPPPPPKKVRKKRVKTKPAENTQTAAAATPGTPGNQATPVAEQGAVTPSPIGQLTIGDSALGERTKHDTADLIASTTQGVNAIKRTLTPEEKITAEQIHTFLKQAQQALDNGDTDGGLKLATKAKLLLDELTKP